MIAYVLVTIPLILNYSGKFFYEGSKLPQVLSAGLVRKQSEQQSSSLGENWWNNGVSEIKTYIFKKLSVLFFLPL